MFSEITLLEILLPLLGILSDVGRTVPRNVASLNILADDATNLLY